MSDPIAKALKNRYPTLTGQQRDRLETAILREFAEAIGNGHGIGAVCPLPDGSLEITQFNIEAAAAASTDQP